MRYGVEKSGTIIGIQTAPQISDAGNPRRVNPATWRDAAKRNFILQLGFEEPAPSVCRRQYSALVFQPKIVLTWIVAGILFQSWVIFAAPFCGGVRCFRT
jgi:hypothetical protein